MDPRRYLCPACRTGDGVEDIADVVGAGDSFTLGQHVCVVCDRTFSAEPIRRPPWLVDREALEAHGRLHP